MYTDTITLFNFHALTGQWYASTFSGVDVGAAKAGRDTAKDNIAGRTPALSGKPEGQTCLPTFCVRDKI